MPESKARALRRAKIRAFHEKYNVEPTFLPNFKGAEKSRVEKDSRKELIKEMKERGFSNVNSKRPDEKCDTSVFERMKRKNEEIRDEEFMLLHMNRKERKAYKKAKYEQSNKEEETKKSKETPKEPPK